MGRQLVGCNSSWCPELQPRATPEETELHVLVLLDRLRALPEGGRRRDCHFDDIPCLSLLKHLTKVEGGAAE